MATNGLLRTASVATSYAIGRIDNPFQHYPNIPSLKECGQRFAYKVDRKNPNNNLFEKAACIAYDPLNWHNDANLRLIGVSQHEADALRNARNFNFWHQPQPLQATVVALCFSAIVQGFSQSILNGSNITLPQEFGLQDEHNNWNGQQSLWIFAGLNAIVYLSAGLCGCWLSDPIQYHFSGRKRAILASACVCFASTIGAAFTNNWKTLMVCRALLGCGLGAKASVTPIFCSEASPSYLRGAFVINWQMYDACGIWLGFSSGLLLPSTGNLSWRLQTASACLPAAALILLIWTVPESPRWLLKQGRYGEAFASMCALRHSQLEAAVELIFANEQVQVEVDNIMKDSSPRAVESGLQRRSSRPQYATQADTGRANGNITRGTQRRASHNSALLAPNIQDAVEATNYWRRIWSLFNGDARTRRATIAAAVVMLCQQLCGVNIIAFYGTTFFRDINRTPPTSIPTKALWMSWGIGLTNFIFAIPAYFLIDKKGRKFLLLITYPGMIVAMLGACLSFLREDEDTRFILVCTFMFIFIAFYSFGQGPVAFAYASEVFPLLYREAGMSFSVFVNLTGAGVLTLLVPQAQVTESAPELTQRSWQNVQITLLAVFTFLNVLSMGLIFVFVPDTAGATIERQRGQPNYLSLEELDGIFKHHTWDRVKREWANLTSALGLERQYISPNMYNFTEGELRALLSPEQQERLQHAEQARVRNAGNAPNPAENRAQNHDADAIDEVQAQNHEVHNEGNEEGIELRRRWIAEDERNAGHGIAEEGQRVEMNMPAERIDGQNNHGQFANPAEREIVIRYLENMAQGLRRRGNT